jgi:hypothetical protein
MFLSHGSKTTDIVQRFDMNADTTASRATTKADNTKPPKTEYDYYTTINDNPRTTRGHASKEDESPYEIPYDLDLILNPNGNANKRDFASGCVVIAKKSKPNDEIVLYSSINAHDNNKLKQSQITDAYEHANGTPIVPEKHFDINRETARYSLKSSLIVDENNNRSTSADYSRPSRTTESTHYDIVPEYETISYMISDLTAQKILSQQSKDIDQLIDDVYYSNIESNYSSIPNTSNLLNDDQTDYVHDSHNTNRSSDPDSKNNCTQYIDLGESDWASFGAFLSCILLFSLLFLQEATINLNSPEK